MAGVDLLLKNVDPVFAGKMLQDKFAEIGLRDLVKKWDKFGKFAVELAKQKQDGGERMGGAMGMLNVVLQVANLAATLASTVIICKKLDNVDQQLNNIHKSISEQKDFDFEMQIAHPCRRLISDYKRFVEKIQKGKPVSGDEQVDLICECQNYLLSLYNLSGKLPMESVLDLIFTLLPVYANSIMLYYKKHYEEEQGKHTLHDEWMDVFNMLISEKYVDQIQDDLFLRSHKTNRQVNEYLAYHMAIVKTYHEKIDQLLELMSECGSEEGYESAMRWSKLYMEQQKKSLQAELENEYGHEIAEEIMSQAMQEDIV